MESTTLVFELNKEKILNANNKLHYMVHGKIVSFLRETAAQRGLELHPEEEQAAVKKRLSAINADQNWVLMKKRARSKLKKNTKLSSKEIDAQVDADYETFRPEFTVADVPVKYLFDKFNVVITVSPPTRRRLDPPNLYPTVKALIDGFTDAALWEDDNFEHMNQMSFRYGAPTGTKGLFRLEFQIEEITNSL